MHLVDSFSSFDDKQYRKVGSSTPTSVIATVWQVSSFVGLYSISQYAHYKYIGLLLGYSEKYAKNYHVKSNATLGLEIV